MAYSIQVADSPNIDANPCEKSLRRKVGLLFPEETWDGFVKKIG